MADLPVLPFARSGLLGTAPMVAELRRRCPLARVRTEVGDEAWLVTRYEDVRALLDDPRLGRAHPEPQRAARMTNSALFGGPLGDYETEDDDHRRMRALLSPSFSPARIRALREPIEALVDGLLDRMGDRPSPVDLHECLSFPLPALVICELLGVPFEDRDRFRAWSEEMADTRDAERSQRGLQALIGYMRELVARKREHPGADMISDLAAAHGGALDDDAVAGLSAGMLFAGHETTMVRIDLGVLLLLIEADQRRRMLDDPALLTSTVEEVLRFMPGGGGTLPRYAREPIDLHSARIEPGDLVLLDLAAANHDPHVFADPDRADLARRPNPHLTFGHGSRYCIGAALARLELQVALPRLFQRFPHLRLAVPIDELPMRTGTLTGGLAALPVTL